MDTDTPPVPLADDEDSEVMASPDAVKALRIHEKSQHTRQINRIRAAIKLQERKTILKTLRARMVEHFQTCLDLNARLQTLSGRSQDGWAYRLREEHMSCKAEVDNHLATRASSVTSCSSMNSLVSLGAQEASPGQNPTVQTVTAEIVSSEEWKNLSTLDRETHNPKETFQHGVASKPFDAQHRETDIENLSVYLRKRDAKIEKLKAQLDEQRVLRETVDNLEEGQEYLISMLQRERNERRSLEEQMKKRSDLQPPSQRQLPSVAEPNDNHTAARPPCPSEDRGAIPRRSTVAVTTDDDRWIYGEDDEENGGNRVTCRAPKLDIRKFDGDPKKWPMFISSFRSMIDSMRCSDAIKLTYLRELLTDDVRKSIAGTLCRPALYRRALEELHRKYGHPHWIARAYTDQLLAIEPMRKEDNAALRKFAAEVHETVSTLVEYKFTRELNSGGTLSQLVDKLPERYQDKWGKRVWKAQPEVLNLEHFDIFLEEIMMSKKAARPNDYAGKGATATRKTSGSYAGQPRVHAIQHEQAEALCAACKEPSHHLKDCGTFAALNAEQRWPIVKENRLCFACLGSGHRSRECRKRGRCDADGCEKRHHPLLHGSTVKAAAATSRRPPYREQPSVNATQHWQATPTSLLPVVPVCIQNGEYKLYTHALLDPGSDRSLTRSDAARKLRLKGPSIRIRPRTFHGQDPVIQSMAVSYTISSVDGVFTKQMERTLVVPRLTGADRRYSLKNIADKYSHLEGIPLPVEVPEAITLLLGTDATIHVHEQLAVVKPAKGEKIPAAVLTPFGWTLFGPVLLQGGRPNVSAVNMINSYVEADEPETLVKTLWYVNCLGITSKPPRSDEDQRTMQLLEETTKNVGNRYEAALLWKQDRPDLPDNRTYALHRFYMLEARLMKDPTLAKGYERTIDEYVKDGFAKLTEETSPAVPVKVLYLPHHAVTNPNKPGKLRVVFDASARHLGGSLNDALLKGPDLSTNLIEILLRFRMWEIAIASDIEKMYHQVRVRECDQSALRYLWRSPGSPETPKTYQMMVHVFDAVSSPTTSIYALHRTAKDHKQDFPEAAEKVSSNICVDNFLDSCATSTKRQRSHWT